MDILLALLLLSTSIVVFLLVRITGQLEELLDRQARMALQSIASAPVLLGHTTTNPVSASGFVATNTPTVSEESLKYAEGKITEELLARGTPASAERVREHVKSLLGA